MSEYYITYMTIDQTDENTPIQRGWSQSRNYRITSTDNPEEFLKVTFLKGNKQNTFQLRVGGHYIGIANDHLSVVTAKTSAINFEGKRGDPMEFSFKHNDAPFIVVHTYDHIIRPVTPVEKGYNSSDFHLVLCEASTALQPYVPLNKTQTIPVEAPVDTPPPGRVLRSRSRSSIQNVDPNPPETSRANSLRKSMDSEKRPRDEVPRATPKKEAFRRTASPIRCLDVEQYKDICGTKYSPIIIDDKEPGKFKIKLQLQSKDEKLVTAVNCMVEDGLIPIPELLNYMQNGGDEDIPHFIENLEKLNSGALPKNSEFAQQLAIHRQYVNIEPVVKPVHEKIVEVREGKRKRNSAKEKATEYVLDNKDPDNPGTDVVDIITNWYINYHPQTLRHSINIKLDIAEEEEKIDNFIREKNSMEIEDIIKNFDMQLKKTKLLSLQYAYLIGKCWKWMKDGGVDFPAEKNKYALNMFGRRVDTLNRYQQLYEFLNDYPRLKGVEGVSYRFIVDKRSSFKDYCLTHPKALAYWKKPCTADKEELTDALGV